MNHCTAFTTLTDMDNTCLGAPRLAIYLNCLKPALPIFRTAVTVIKHCKHVFPWKTKVAVLWNTIH